MAGSLVTLCALGPSGIVRNKREGDGATPAGSFRLRNLYLRQDRIARCRTGLPSRQLTRQDGWCDDVLHPRYNRYVHLPFAGRHEALWRDDHLYDLVLVIDYNLDRVHRNWGSAIFLHVAAPGLPPTAGCVAIPRPALLRLLPRLSKTTRIVIG